MKNLLIIAALLLTATGCSSFFYANGFLSVTKRSYIGMPVEELKELAGSFAHVETLTPAYTIYRLEAGDNDMFYYFDSNGKLYKMESEELYNRNRKRNERHRRQ